MHPILRALGFEPQSHQGDCPPAYDHYTRPSRRGLVHLCIRELVRFELHLGHHDRPQLSWVGSADDLPLLPQWLDAHGL